jgi:hypothetical protein
MKVTIEIKGGEKDYTVKTATSEPLNDETRLVLAEAVEKLTYVTADIDQTHDKLIHMKKERDDMKERNKSAREFLDELSDSLPVWVKSAYPGGGAEVCSGNEYIAKAKADADSIAQWAETRF